MWKNSFRVGMLLGVRQIQHAGVWTTGLIIFVMMLTFLNLVVVSGILVGLIEGSVQANLDQHTGDIFLSTPKGEEFIEKTGDILKTLETIPGIAYYSARFSEPTTIEANYRTRRDPTEVRDTVATRIVGIDPIAEDNVTGLSNYIVEGEYLQPGDEGKILLGSNMIEEYAPDFGDVFATIQNIDPGTRVRVTANGRTKEYIVKGIVKSKVDETSFRAFMLDTDFRTFVGRTNLNVNEIAIIIEDGADLAVVKQGLVASGFENYARVRTSREALPQALEDIIVTFEILGTAIGSIGLLVASITIFIVIFVNAITRRKFIGILKGIGIEARAIQFSYVFQAFVYAAAGSALAMLFIYLFLVPFFLAHPIDFPFSDGILVAPIGGTLIRLVVLIISTLIAGYIPARIVIKKNTLDSILGR